MKSNEFIKKSSGKNDTEEEQDTADNSVVVKNYRYYTKGNCKYALMCRYYHQQEICRN